MRAKRAAVFILILFIAVHALAGCSYINRFRQEDPDRTVTYYNEDYHFYLTHPAYFSKTEIKESEENGDEINIKLIADENDLIDIDIRYKNEGGASSSNIYDYIARNEFAKSKIVPLSKNSFSYDDRDGESKKYYIYAATKRMIYVISYEPGENNAKEELVVNSLGFEFDTYANVPKENAFLSSPYLFAMRYCRVQIPAEADLTFDIEPIYGENGTADYSFARRVTAVAPHYKAVFGSPLITRYGYLQYDEIDLDADAAAIIEELCPDLENVVFESEAEKRTNGKVRYSIITFTCD